MIAIADLESISAARLADAKTLLTAGRFDGAVYLCGYAVEVALKVRACRTLNWTGFPSSSSEFQNLTSFRTHDLDVLLRLSGMESTIRQQHFLNWNQLAKWKVETRYNVIGTASEEDAKTMIRAAEALLGIL